MKEIFNFEYERPLVIGTGGGNDIVSATLVLADLLNQGKKPSLAGICSPGAYHTYNGKREKPVNRIVQDTKRYIPSKNPAEISFVDSKIPDALRENGINVNVYNLSGRYGTSKLVRGLRELIRKNEYDGIIAVDVGGDILARGKRDPTILSPLMDFTTLYVLSQIKIPSILVEFGLQTDGELRPKSCEEILSELQSSGILLETPELKKSDPPVKLFKKIYEGIGGIRHGHTAAMTLRTFEETQDIHTEYRFRVQVLDRKWFHNFPITLESKYFGKAFLIDLKKLAEIRELAFPYKNPLELYLRTKRIVDTKTEMDMLYSKVNNNYIWLGLLCPQIRGGERREILNFGLDNLDTHADVALLWKKDAPSTKMFRTDLGDFILTGNSREKVLKSKDDITRMLKCSIKSC